MDHLDKTFAMIVGSQLAIRDMIPEEKRQTFFEVLDSYKKKAITANDDLESEENENFRIN